MLSMTLHVSEPYSRAVITLSENTLSLGRLNIFRADQTLFNLRNAHALFILALTSSSAPPAFVITLPRYEKLL